MRGASSAPWRSSGAVALEDLDAVAVSSVPWRASWAVALEDLDAVAAGACWTQPKQRHWVALRHREWRAVAGECVDSRTRASPRQALIRRGAAFDPGRSAHSR